ncbi:hypothetical protein FOMPIDRAFT_1053706 [Fomitopsis schrenkii]|uniref:HTH CENPB-type domain-containing protein n=1 Tax=Fomitopsis schrenkii TaxID=2126942 RepID=S8F296_FOMSC|nr:hypothetical protein FOMPIDRAFT_1053706 [Fomitopsis schrenkii]
MSHPGLRDGPVFINWSIHCSRTQQSVAHAAGEPPQDPDAAGRLRLPDTSAEKPQQFGAAKLPYAGRFTSVYLYLILLRHNYRQYERIDAGMESWLMEYVQNRVHISDRLITENGLSIAADLNQLQRERGETPVNYPCGSCWLCSFKARYGIVKGQATKVGEAAGARPEAPGPHPPPFMPAQWCMYHAQLRTRDDATSPVGTTESEEAWDDDDDDFSDEEADAPMGVRTPAAYFSTDASAH